MQTNNLSQFSLQVFLLLQPYMADISTEMMDVKDDNLADELPESVKKLWKSLKKGIVKRPQMLESLQLILKTPDILDAQKFFQEQLKKMFLEEDENLIREIRHRVNAVYLYQIQQNNQSIHLSNTNEIDGDDNIFIHGDKNISNRTDIDIHLSLDDKVEKLPDTKNDTDLVRYPLHNLTSPPILFLGRDIEFEKIIERLRPVPHSRTHLILIHGVGGIGKTTLALQTAHYFVDEYASLKAKTEEQNESRKEQFEVIVWVTAKLRRLSENGIVNTKPTISNLDDIFKAIATVLKRRDIQQTASFVRRRELIREALYQKRTLLIVDNFEAIKDQGQVALFLEDDLSYPSKAIVTSREGFGAISQAYSIPVRALAMNHRKILIHEACLKRQMTLTEREIQELATGTGGVPLAIEWSVAQMAYTSDVQSVLEKLKNPHNEPAKFCFESAMEKIRKRAVAHQILMALTFFATSASKSALMKVSGITQKGKFEEGLHDLGQLSLINYDQLSNRYDLLPLTQEYALAELDKDPETRLDINERWINFYASIRNREVDPEIGWTIYTDYKPNDQDFFPEMENIFKVISYCLDVNPKYWKQAAKILDDFRASFFAYGYWNERYQFSRKVISIADRENDREILGRTQRLLAWTQCFQGKHEDGLIFAKAALQNAQAGIDDPGISDPDKAPFFQTKYKSLTTLGHIILSQAKFNTKASTDFKKALRYFLQARRIVKRHYHYELFVCNLYLAQTYYDYKKFDYAKELFDLVLQTARNRQHKRGQALALYYLGKIERRCYKHYDEANRYFHESLNIAEQNEDQPLIALVLYAQGQLGEEVLRTDNFSLYRKEDVIHTIRMAIDNFDRLGMQNEAKDAEKFIRERLLDHT